MGSWKSVSDDPHSAAHDRVVLTLFDRREPSGEALTQPAGVPST